MHVDISQRKRAKLCNLKAKNGGARRCMNNSKQMQICRREAASLCKLGTGKPFVHREPQLLKSVHIRRAILKIVLAFLSLDMSII
jgi:hypothetical protein